MLADYRNEPSWVWSDIEGAIIGGIFISLATTLNFFIYGRNEGLHSMFSHTLKFRRDPDQLMRLSFLFGAATLPFFAFMGVFNKFDYEMIEVLS